MYFKFNVNISESDYIEFNQFHSIRSHYGRKQLATARVTITVIMCIFVFIILLSGGFSLTASIETIPVLILILIFNLILPRFTSYSIKNSIIALKKNGKLGYSPSAVLEFFDDRLIETTDINRTEMLYSGVEKVCIADNHMIYFYTSSSMAYILPFASFESKEQFDCFMDFIKVKFSIIEVY